VQFVRKGALSEPLPLWISKKPDKPIDAPRLGERIAKESGNKFPHSKDAPTDFMSYVCVGGTSHDL
jgi:hypothetical protein